MSKEDFKAYPYKPPPKAVRRRYKKIFNLKEPLQEKPSKVLFNRLLAMLAILVTFPVWGAILIAYLLQAILDPSEFGNIFASYKGMSRGQEFMKLKFRLVKRKLINREKARQGDFQAYPSERDPKNLTWLGSFLKKYYFDEFPQLINILRGDMNFVGPRPLAKQHYDRNVAEGHVLRKVMKAGIFSQTHVRKGTDNFTNDVLNYEYLHRVMSQPWYKSIGVDIDILWRGFIMILKGQGF